MSIHIFRKWTGERNVRQICTALILLCCFCSLGAAGKKADVDISGYGITGSLELKRMLKSLDLNWKKQETFDANFIEDTALILLSRIKRDGFLKPEILVTLTFENGTREAYRWREIIDPPLPRTIRAVHADFKIKKGILYRYDKITFDGLTSLSDKEARAFFVERGVLLPLKRTRVYTPQKLERGLENLAEVLMRKGYEMPAITPTNIVMNGASGKVDLTIHVEEGPQSIIRSVREETLSGTNTEPIHATSLHTNVPYSKLWQQDLAQTLRNTNYHRGYPDTTVEVTPLRREPRGEFLDVDLLAKVRLGDQIKVGRVDIEGEKKSKQPFLERQTRVKPGEWLDRIQAEQGRMRLARLGIFDSVEMRYDIVDAQTRNVVYHVKEGKRLNANLLFGYGSYELARLGVEWEQFNVLGRAHHSRLRAVQSVKSTTADYLYTMPEFIGEEVDVFLNSSFLNRREVSFTREEFGGGAGAKTFFQNIGSDFSTRYNYQILTATDAVANEGPTKAAVSAIILDLRHDERDSPLYPRRGYKVAASFETASEFLGGDVNYWKFETQTSYHQPLDEGRWLHVGLSHGFIVSVDKPQIDIPFNKRFFPGGESSVRGFQFGEAAPRNAIGELVGAEAYTVGNFEFEQALTDKFSFVSFVDGIGFAKEIGNYPFNDYLVSAGGGFRWKTIIGPVRLEYGYNLIRRDLDPVGTLHFSIGFPF